MMDYETVLADVLPNTPRSLTYSMDSDLETVERTLRDISYQATAALVALEAARTGSTSDERLDGLGKILALANSAGASGPLGSQVERLVDRLARVQTAIRVADACAQEAAQA